MATARQRLFEELKTLLMGEFGSDAREKLKKKLSEYRIQLRSDATVSNKGTARQILETSVLLIWQKKPVQYEKKVDDLLASFRMQLKGGSGDKRRSKTNGQTWSIAANTIRNAVMRASKQKKVNPNQSSLEAISALKRISSLSLKAEPIAGGPQKAKHQRGQCPKCHSMGVVLAKSYSGDEHYTCIYCGFQSFKSVQRLDTGLPIDSGLLESSLESSE